MRRLTCARASRTFGSSWTLLVLHTLAAEEDCLVNCSCCNLILLSHWPPSLLSRSRSRGSGGGAVVVGVVLILVSTKY